MACEGLGSVSAAQINSAASALGIPCEVVRAQINEESGGNPNAVSPSNAQGVAQFLPSTFSGTGCSGSPFNVADAMACYVKYMGQLLKQEGGSVRNALAAYNAGPGNIGAGMGYANTILGNAGAGGGLKSGGGTGSFSGGGGGGGSGGGGGGGGGGDFPGSATWLTTGSDIETAALISGGPGGILGEILDPFQTIKDSAAALARLFAPPTFDFLQVFKVLTNAFGAISSGVSTIIHDIQWLFVPSHWVRIFCFLFGITVMIPAAYALMHTGQGDMYLAMGIALMTLAGVLLFIAFHNLPDDVRNLQQLLAWISQSIRQGSAAGSATGTTVTAAVTPTAGGTGAASGGGGGFSPDSGSSGSPIGGGGTFIPVGNATGLFPTLTPGGIIPAGGALPGGTGGPLPGRTYPSGF